MIMDKRAQSAEALVMAFGGIVIVVLIIAFIILAQNTMAEKRMGDAMNRVDNSITLLNYLRTPVDPEHNIADMLAEYNMTKKSSLKGEIAARSSQILGKAFKGDYSLSIELDGEEIVKMDKACSKGGVAAQEIMLYDGNKAKVEMICD